MKRRRNKKRKIIPIIFATILILVGCSIFLAKDFKAEESAEKDVVETPKEEEYSLKLAMVGDALIHDKLYNEAHKNANYEGYDFTPMFTYIKDIIKDYDLAYYNQETILGGSEMGLSSYPAFNSPYELGDALIDAGFNLVSLATNHTLDRGEKAVLNSANYWSDKDVLTAGSYASFEDRNKVQIKEKNNITYTLLSYTYGTNGIPVPEGKDYLVNIWPTNGNNPNSDTAYQNYKKIVKEDIERVRDKVDVLMVAMHWGVEYTHTPTAYQEDMAHFLAENNVDIVIGSHPHVVMPVTWIDNTLVIYSLGNFISAQETKNDYNTVVGLMSMVKITKRVKGEESEIILSDLNNDLIFTYYDNYHNFKVIPFSNSDIKTHLKDSERLYNKYSAVIKSKDEAISVSAIGE